MRKGRARARAARETGSRRGGVAERNEAEQGGWRAALACARSAAERWRSRRGRACTRISAKTARARSWHQRIVRSSRASPVSIRSHIPPPVPLDVRDRCFSLAFCAASTSSLTAPLDNVSSVVSLAPRSTAAPSSSSALAGHTVMRSRRGRGRSAAFRSWLTHGEEGDNSRGAGARGRNNRGASARVEGRLAIIIAAV